MKEEGEMFMDDPIAYKKRLKELANKLLEKGILEAKT
jgi:hypothetical protein